MFNRLYYIQMISALVSKYQNERNYYLTEGYNEAQLRADFLDPFLELLGWDIQNKQAKVTAEREVVVEVPLKESAGSSTKKPDYALRLFSEQKFFVEAKKPFVDISLDPAPAQQVRRYGFTARMKVSVLSNFEYLAIYDCSHVVRPEDGATEARVKLYHYTEYVDKFDEICRLLGRDSVYSGAFDDEWSDIDARLQRFSIDDLFLEQINKWRLILGKEILYHKPDIDKIELNDLVQSYLNSIIFLRVCEDRNLEEYKTLLNLASEGDFNKLVNKFQEADRKYNSGLFSHKMNNEIIKDNASSFWAIIKELYFPYTAYSFSVISSDILGRIYEVFLGEELVLVDGGVKLQKKPEHEDRDIVTTPTAVIKDILNLSLYEQMKNLGPDEILELKIADISCGSGAFLLEAYQAINDHLIDWYLMNNPSQLTQLGVSNYKLPFKVKRQILVNCLFGVDKDFGAVEACKFGLLLKLLENENNLSIPIPALPSLNSNVHYGNSLVLFEDTPEADRALINPLKDLGVQFDVIIGNPPYMSTEDMKAFTPKELPIYKRKYISSHQQFDKYFLFIEKGFELLKPGGRLGYIVPSKFMKVASGQKLREYITTNGALESIVSFGANQLFKDKSTYTCIVVLGKTPKQSFSYVEVDDLLEWSACAPQEKMSNSSTISLSELNDEGWIMTPSHLSVVRMKVLENTVSLEDIVGPEGVSNGIQTSANKVYIHKPLYEDDKYMYFNYDSREWKIERELTRPYFKTASKQGALSSYRMLQPNSFVVYPYVRKRGRVELVDITTLEKFYPFAFQFLSANRHILSSPKRDIKPVPETPNEWYRYGRHQSLEKCDVGMKIVVGVLSQGDKYAVDMSRTVVSSGGTAGYCVITIPEGLQYSIYYLQAILNSKYTEWYASLVGEVFRGGYMARGTKTLKKLPIKIINFEDEEQKALHDAIAVTQQDLIHYQAEIDKYQSNPRKLVLAEREFAHSKRALNEYLKKLYNLSESDDIVPIIKKIYASS